jgi:hypothetical protein
MARIKPIGIRELIDSVSEEIMQETGSFPFLCLERVEMEIAFTVERNLDGDIAVFIVNHRETDSRADIQTLRVMFGPNRDFHSMPEPLLTNHRDAIAE